MQELDLNTKCAGIELAQLTKLLSKNDFSYNIILKRKNYLRRTVSVLVGRKEKKWHSTDRNTLASKVYVDVNSFVIGTNHKSLLEHFKDIDDYYLGLDSLLQQYKVLHLTYEDDIQEDPLIAYRKVCSFIGCEYQAPTIRMTRTNPFSLKDMIVNLDEVRRCLEGTKYFWMLEE